MFASWRGSMKNTLVATILLWMILFQEKLFRGGSKISTKTYDMGLEMHGFCFIKRWRAVRFKRFVRPKPGLKQDKAIPIYVRLVGMWLEWQPIFRSTFPTGSWLSTTFPWWSVHPVHTSQSSTPSNSYLQCKHKLLVQNILQQKFVLSAPLHCKTALRLLCVQWNVLLTCP